MEEDIKGLLVMYIDVGQFPPYKAEAFIERMRDSFKRQNNLPGRLTNQGYEMLWVPVRPNSQTRVEMVPCVEGCIPVINHYHCPQSEDDLPVLNECECGVCLRCEGK